MMKETLLRKHTNLKTNRHLFLRQNEEPCVACKMMESYCTFLIQARTELHITRAFMYHTEMVNHSVLTCSRWIAEEKQNGVFPLHPSRGTKTSSVDAIINGDTSRTSGEITDSELGNKNTH